MNTLKLICAATLLTSACAQNSDLARSSGPTVDGAADGTGDQADTQCRSVLRTATYNADGDRYTWDVTVEADAREKTVELLYRTDDLPNQLWYTVKPADQATTTTGRVAYYFHLEDGVPSGSLHGGIDMIPFVVDHGQRWFDHNRIASPTGDYRLDGDAGWTIADDASVCSSGDSSLPRYVLAADFTQTLQSGPAKAGQQLEVDYDGHRLRDHQDCMGSEDSVSATAVVMFAAFDGDVGNATQTDVETYSENYAQGCPATPCVSDQAKQPILQLPPDAHEVDLWFACVPGFSQGGMDNWKYDSNYGQNYVVPLH